MPARRARRRRPPSREDVQRALDYHRERLMALPGVVDLGLGRKVTGDLRRPEFAIRVYVRTKHGKARLPKAALVPRRLRGITPSGRKARYFVPTDVVKGGGPLQALSLEGGQRIIGHSGEVGTLGLVYQSVSGRAYLLTNAHVAVPRDFKPNQLTSSVALSQSAGGRDVAVVRRFVPIRTSGRANTMDAALGHVYQDERVSYRLIQGENVLVSGQVDFDERGGTIYQYTNRSGVTKYFQHPDAGSPTVVTFGSGGSARFDRFVQLTGVPGRNHLVEPGDSGSLLVRRDPDGLKAVALVFAGSHNRVAVYPIRTVLRRLGQAEASRNGQSENVGIEYG